MACVHTVYSLSQVSVPVARKPPVVVDTDEFPRPDTTVETLAKLRPAFVKVSRVIPDWDF